MNKLWLKANGDSFGSPLLENNKPMFIIVHHSDTAEGTVETFDKFHREVRGWKCIGYHYVIYKDGSVHKGRFELMNGSHCPGMNTRSLGICLVGDFNAELPTNEQLASCAQLCNNIMGRYTTIKTAFPGSILGHAEALNRYYNPFHTRKRHTSCPGARFSMSELLSEIKKLRNTYVDLEVW